MTTTNPPAAVVPPVKSNRPSTAAGRVRQKLSSRVATVVAIVIALFWTVPTFGLLISSFRPANDIKTTGWWTFFSDPQLTLDNYNDVLFGGSASSGQLAGYFINSLVISIPAVLFPMAICSLAAYALAWIDFKGRDWVYILIFALQIVPLQMALVPLLRFFSQGTEIFGIQLTPAWGLSGEGLFIQVWFAHTCFALPFGVYLLHNFISELPRDIMERPGSTAPTTRRSSGASCCR